MVNNNNFSSIKNKLIVVKLKNLYPDDPVDRLRGLNVVNALQKRGWNIHLFNNQKNIDLIIYLDDYNLYDRLVYEYIKAEKTVIDIQDNHLHRHNPASQFVQQTHKNSKIKRIIAELKKGFLPLVYKLFIKKAWYKLYIESMKNADHLICSSHALSKVYQSLNPNTTTISDSINEVATTTAEKKAKVSICWVGTENNIVYLQLIDEAIASLQAKHDFDFYIISAKSIFNDPKLASVLKNFKMQYHFTEWSNDTILSELQKHHIAVAPLPPMTEKSTNKILTYMAAGLPTVASGASDYKQLFLQHQDSLNMILQV